MIYVVSGLFRSGTTALMESVEAGGMSVVHSEIRDQYNRVNSDANYSPNPKGLYEPTVKDMSARGWPKQHDGKALKAVGFDTLRLAVHEYRIVFMRRDVEEIRQSFESAFRHKLTCQQIENAIEDTFIHLQNRKDVELLELQYMDLLSDPVSAFRRIAEFGWPINIQKAADTINPIHYRRRLHRLEVHSGQYAGTVLEPNLTIGL